jgi:hypothetical protein
VILIVGRRDDPHVASVADCLIRSGRDEPGPATLDPEVLAEERAVQTMPLDCGRLTRVVRCSISSSTRSCSPAIATPFIRTPIRRMRSHCCARGERPRRGTAEQAHELTSADGRAWGSYEADVILLIELGGALSPSQSSIEASQPEGAATRLLHRGISVHPQPDSCRLTSVRVNR